MDPNGSQKRNQNFCLVWDMMYSYLCNRVDHFFFTLLNKKIKKCLKPTLKLEIDPYEDTSKANPCDDPPNKKSI